MPLTHEVVLQSAMAAAVGVMSMEAKLRPLSVAVAPLVGALPLLKSANDTTGADTTWWNKRFHGPMVLRYTAEYRQM